jgi:hypothetical protein
MSAHVSVFDLKRFAEARLLADELPAFERHLAVCGDCAGRLQKAATRELHARGLGVWAEATPFTPSGVEGRSWAALIAFAASVLVVLSMGRVPLKFSEPPREPAYVEQHGAPPLAVAPVDAGMMIDGTIAFYDGGGSVLVGPD